ncbi:carboxymuconolactone decarboxylase family protein [Ferrimicrobium acidiphilum]|uniref:carboxymuconolactone decarboxylase family protein n=1 Tax=Ferrimicrobium acidiphilum TaxID=121039 RepID=UPI0023F3EA9E|nr:carboxymuconolactone decarboxylase family protein [Ferrimicrobium acidiphilum]
MADQESIDTASIENAYRELTGTVPANIAERIRIAGISGRNRSILRIEELRSQLIMDNPLGAKTAQLVHFAQLLAIGEEKAAELHADAARKAGASLEELVGVVELALITAGMPAYSRGVAILGRVFPENQT